jgi:hypothetical protein
MIRVTIDLIPQGVEARKRTLYVMDIANDGTGDQDTGNYRGTLRAEYTSVRMGYVRGFNRRKQSVWSLVGAFLKLWGHTGHSPKLMSKEPLAESIETRVETTREPAGETPALQP